MPGTYLRDIVRGIAANAEQVRRRLKGVSVTRREYLCLGLLIALWIVNNALWACQDSTPPRYDDSRYLYVSLRQLAVLRGPWQGFGELMNISHNGRPPLYTLVAQPVYVLVGTSEDFAIVATNALFVVILVLSVYGIGKRLFDSRTGLLASILLAGYPTLTIMSRRYMPHFAAVAMVALGAYVLLSTDDFRNTRYALLFGGVCGLGMLTSAWVVFGLLGLGVWFACRSLYVVCRHSEAEERPKPLVRVLGNVILALVIALALLLPWYVHHAVTIFSILQRSYEPKLYAPVKDLYRIAAFLWYVLNMHRTISLFFVTPFVIGVLTALMRRRASHTMLLWWFGSSYLLLSLVPKSLVYYLIVVLPTMALLSAFWVFQLRQRAVRLLLVGLLVLASGCLFLEAAWELRYTPEQLLALGVSTAPPRHENWHVEDILALVAEDSQGETTSLLIAGDTPLFFPEYFQYQAIRTGFEGSVLNCRRAKPESLLKAEYVAVLSLPRWKRMRRIWGITPCETWSELLRSPPESFRASHSLLGTFPLPQKSQVKVYKLTRPLSADEIVALLEEILLLNPDDQKVQEALRRTKGGEEATDFILSTRLGEALALLGYKLNLASAGDRATVRVTLWWRALERMDRDYTVFIHVVGEGDNIWAQEDRLLEHDGRRTSTWEVREVARESYQLEVPSDAPTGDYIVKVGIYYWKTGERLPVWDQDGERIAGDAILLGTIPISG